MMADSDFNAHEPLAFLITWTTYGTWLPGDMRGWYSKFASGEQPPDAKLEAIARGRMKEHEFRLNAEQREIVIATITQHCAIRGWHLHTANARTNHVHVVVTAPNIDPKIVREQFKAWCTRNLRAAGLERENIWTEGGSARFINTAASLERVVLYAGEGQDRKGIQDA